MFTADSAETNAYEIRTIHGMVYNAMKLFMEINPQLFDDCSHDYTELQSTAAQREATRKAKWERLTELAQKAKSGQATPVGKPVAAARKPAVPPKIDEDSMTQDSQKRLDALKLQDESGSGTRHGRDAESQNSVGTL